MNGKRSSQEVVMADNNPPSFSNLKFPHWQVEYQAALLETDSTKLQDRVLAAEAVIYLRLQALIYSSDGHAERQAIDDAMHALRLIKTEKLNYPDWQK
jgi:hypothetical protein